MAATAANFARNFALTERNKAAATTFGTSTIPPLRDNPRERERLDREAQEQLNQLTEEQKEEINEAVRPYSTSCQYFGGASLTN